MSYLLLSLGGGKDYVGSVEILALLLSGLLHDIDHPGLNNNFQVPLSFHFHLSVTLADWKIVTASHLAMTYNDTSVLESHHCAFGSRLLRDNGVYRPLFSMALMLLAPQPPASGYNAQSQEVDGQCSTTYSLSLSADPSSFSAQICRNTWPT